METTSPMTTPSVGGKISAAAESFAAEIISRVAAKAAAASASPEGGDGFEVDESTKSTLTDLFETIHAGQPSEKTDLLDRMGLEIPASNHDSTVLLTGATGYLGTMLLFTLLKHREQLRMRRLILLTRSGKKQSAHDRIAAILAQDFFKPFLIRDGTHFKELITVVDFDLQKADALLDDKALGGLLVKSNVTHVIHAAANVKFDQTPKSAAESNIGPSLAMQRLARKLRAKHLHISTAFVHGNNGGTLDRPLPQELAKLPDLIDTPEEIYEAMLDMNRQDYCRTAMHKSNFPNMYAFSKCITEHLLAARHEPGQHISMVLRPSIVGPALQQPFEGWSGRMPTTIVGAAMAHLSFPAAVWFASERPVAFIPVDVVARHIINKAFTDNTDNTANAKTGFRLYNTAWNHPIGAPTSFSWISMIHGYSSAAVLWKYVKKSTAAISVALNLEFLPQAFETFLPSSAFLPIHAALTNGAINLQALLTDVPFCDTKLNTTRKVANIPALYYPYCSREFIFETDLLVPDNMDGNRYNLSVSAAGHSFLQKKKEARLYMAKQRLGSGGKDSSSKRLLKSKL